MAKSRSPLAHFSWEPKTKNQGAVREAILSHAVTFVYGCAGTGKSLCSLYTGLELLDRGVKNGGVDGIVVTRPLVTAGPSIGYLPGDVDEKVGPYLRPIHDLIKDSNHPRTQELLEGHGLEAFPAELMRGITFDQKFVLVDEIQNLSPSVLKMLLTRIGEGTKVVLTGDVEQSDIRGANALQEALRLFKNNPWFGMVELTTDDVQRSGIVREVLRVYAADAQRSAA